MTKKKILLNIGLLAGAFILFSSFKSKKTVALPPRVKQIDSPTGAETVFSKVGTKVFDKNKNTIFIYDTEGLGMTVTAFNNGIYSIVYGDSFLYGLPGYVYAKDVTK
jgi:uncharacterized membrane protein YagU involved in acid resistance